MTEHENSKAMVMIIDDTPANLKLLGDILCEKGYAVAAFPRGALALRAALDNPPDLILLDIMMPEMDGYEVCRRLKSNTVLADIPVLFMSALDDVEGKVEAFSLGGVDYITKPFNQSEILARIRTQIALRRQQLEILHQKSVIQDSLDNLKKMEIQRDSLVHMIVHDMRSPLMGIISNAEMMDMDGTVLEKEEQKELIRRISHSATILQEMISNLLDVSRMEGQQMPLEIVHTDLRDLVSAALSLFDGFAKECKIVYVPPDVPLLVRCDSTLTRRIIQNLVGNAIKYTGRNGVVTVAAEKKNGNVVLKVTDTGPGIPAEYHKQIFEKFWQVPGRKEGVMHSSGLGLTFCKLAVEAQGGNIGVLSDNGNGCTFHFSLPYPA